MKIEVTKEILEKLSKEDLIKVIIENNKTIQFIPYPYYSSYPSYPYYSSYPSYPYWGVSNV
jgi:hypothetical protein